MSDAPTDVIDLRLYLDTPTREAVSHLYNQMSWACELEQPLDSWEWRFADVCALYFRAEIHADYLREQAPDLRRSVHQIVRSAIADYMEDEYS